jgi:hypothetical protein
MSKENYYWFGMPDSIPFIELAGVRDWWIDFCAPSSAQLTNLCEHVRMR